MVCEKIRDLLVKDTITSNVNPSSLSVICVWLSVYIFCSFQPTTIYVTSLYFILFMGLLLFIESNFYVMYTLCNQTHVMFLIKRIKSVLRYTNYDINTI